MTTRRPAKVTSKLPLRDYLQAGRATSAAKVLPQEQPSDAAFEGRVAQAPLFSAFQLRAAFEILATADQDRSRTLALVSVLYKRDGSLWYSGAVDLAEVAVRRSLLSSGGVEALDERNASTALESVRRALGRQLQATRKEKARAWNVLLLAVVALSRNLLPFSSVVHTLSRARELMDLANVGWEAPASAAGTLALISPGAQPALLTAVNDLLSETQELRVSNAALAEKDAAHGDELATVVGQRDAHAALLASVQADLERERTVNADLQSQLASAQVQSGHEVRTARGAMETFLTGPLATLLEDAVTLVDLGPEHVSMLKEKLMDMQNEIRRAEG